MGSPIYSHFDNPVQDCSPNVKSRQTKVTNTAKACCAAGKHLCFKVHFVRSVLSFAPSSDKFRRLHGNTSSEFVLYSPYKGHTVFFT
eukprot:scaffold3119_cov92-Amphora_coffeaeformis.AAC.2